MSKKAKKQLKSLIQLQDLKLKKTTKSFKIVAERKVWMKTELFNRMRIPIEKGVSHQVLLKRTSMEWSKKETKSMRRMSPTHRNR